MIESSKLLYLILPIIVLFSACAGSVTETLSSLTAESMYLNPSPLPDFIQVIEPPQNSPLSTSQEICVAVSQAALWEQGDTASDLQSHIVSNTYFIIEDSRIQPEYASTIGGFALNEHGR